MKPAEDRLIQKIAKAARLVATGQKGSLRLGIGDDAALWRARPAHEIILTCDWFLEGYHFLRAKHPPHSVGWKCLARAVSDVAAMGGEPRCFLLSLALPKNVLDARKGWTAAWLSDFLRGLRLAAGHFGCPLAGGDTTRSRRILINVTVIGEVPRRQVLCRSGAKAGDKIFVSGTLGQADLGLQLMRGGAKPSGRNGRTLRKHLYPEPRLALGQWLARHRLATSMMDISDGLSSDMSRLCAASNVGARIEAARIPLPTAPRTAPQRFDLLRLALHGGDDYELLFTVSPKDLARIPHAYQGLALSQIGEVTPRRRLILVASNGTTTPLIPGGWDPFRR